MKLFLDKLLEVSTDQEILETVYSEAIQFADACTADGSHFDVRVKTAFTGTGTLIFSIQDSPDGTTYTSRVSSPSYNAAALPLSGAGAPLLSLAIPKGLKKYIRVAYTVSGTFTAGKVTTNLVVEE